MGEMECTMVSTQSLKQNHLFRRLYQRGKSAAGRYVVVYCRKNGLPYNRLGLTVSTKVGHAVVRNRIAAGSGRPTGFRRGSSFRATTL